MINEDYIRELNELITQYKESPHDNLIERIEYYLQILVYQSWSVKSNLRLIENPNRFFKSEEMRKYRSKFSSDNAFTKYHLMIPLLMYLFINHNKTRPALETSLDFMAINKDLLNPGDFAKTKTGAQRFITNTRFASLELRNYGLLRSDRKHFYKFWSLSPLGILAAAQMFFDSSKGKLKTNIHGFSWDKVSEFPPLVISFYSGKVLIKENFNELLQFIFTEDVLIKHFELYHDKFVNFITNLQKALDKTNLSNTEDKKELKNYINTLNSDEEFSKFADSIILRKDIAVNMQVIKDILNSV